MCPMIVKLSCINAAIFEVELHFQHSVINYPLWGSCNKNKSGLYQDYIITHHNCLKSHINASKKVRNFKCAFILTKDIHIRVYFCNKEIYFVIMIFCNFKKRRPPAPFNLGLYGNIKIILELCNLKSLLSCIFSFS